MQNLLMEIYCIILSPQQKRRSASVSVCQAGPRKMPPLQADKAAGMAVYFRPAHSVLHTPGGQRYDVPLCTSLHPFVLICACMCVCVRVCVGVCSLVFVCTFPLLTGWLAAVLESLLTESVGSAGYFYPLACVREQVEALWGYNKVTRRRPPPGRYLWLHWPNVKV